MSLDAVELKSKLETVVAGLNFELADLAVPVVGGRLTIRLYIYSAIGVTLDDCARVSREVSDYLDSEDLIGGRFNLEVSSLGLDRPLVTTRDFARRIGEKVKITYEDETGVKTASGILDESSDTYIKLRTDKKTVTIPVDTNPRGKIVF